MPRPPPRERPISHTREARPGAEAARPRRFSWLSAAGRACRLRLHLVRVEEEPDVRLRVRTRLATGLRVAQSLFRGQAWRAPARVGGTSAVEVRPDAFVVHADRDHLP